MEISKEIINWLEFPSEIVELVLAPYLEMPKGEFPYVMQHHWRMRSVHVDFRMAINKHLVGWTILDNPKNTPKVMTYQDALKADKTVPFVWKAENKNIGKRAETKARQPKEWIKVTGVVKPGSVGATRWGPGVFTIWDKGKVIHGVQKPYFHEYFVKSSIGKNFPSNIWTRIIVRRVGVPALGPRKKPLKKREVMWRIMIPSDQIPYAISKRAIKKGYKPPKTNPMPFPVEWAKKNFPKQFTKWQEWIQGKPKKEEKTCRNCFKFDLCTDPETLANPDRKGCQNWRPREELKKGKFTLHFNSWMGQFVIRGVPKREWYLRLDDKGEKIRTFFFDYDPIYYQPVSGEDQGRVPRKWLDFEGKIPPRTKYNPNKKISSFMKIIDKGRVDIDSETQDGIEIINLKFHGKKLKGKWRLVQEEKRASTYTLEKLSENLANLKFVLQKHWIPLKTKAKFPDDFGHHFDIRFSSGTEFNLYKDPLKTVSEEEIKARRKTCKNIGPWMVIKKKHSFMKVGPLGTFVDPIDEGKIEIYEKTPDFISMKFFGKKLKGYWVYIRKPSGEQVFVKSRLPKPKLGEEILDGDAKTGNYFKPFKEEKKKGWDYFWLHLYDPEDFTRCVADPTEYIPELKNKPPEILDVLVCLYPRPGTIHGARVQAVKVSDKWSVSQASDWIKKLKLHTWSGKQIRKKRERMENLEEEDKKIDEAIGRVLEHIAKKPKETKTEEERKLELEIKKKKLELLEKWLEANK